MALHVGIYWMAQDRWRLQVNRPNRRTETKTVYGPREVAEAAAAEWRAELETHGLSDIPGSTPLVNIIRMRLPLLNLAPGTREYYERLIRLYIDRPAPKTAAERAAWSQIWPDGGAGASYSFSIGRRPVSRITLQDGIDFQYHLIGMFAGRRRAGARSIEESVRLCMNALNYAVAVHAIKVNPWLRLDRVRARDPEVHVPKTAKELGKVTGIDGRTGLMLRLALASGCRRGELLALTWARVDLDAGTLDIRASLDHRDGQFILRPTKSKAGIRSVTLPPAMVAELRSARAEAAVAALAAGKPVADLPVLADDGGWWTPNSASQAARRAMHAAGVPASMHGLRHAHGSLLLSDRINPEAVRRRLGHGAISTTLRHYAHAMVADEPAAAASIGRAMRAGKV